MAIRFGIAPLHHIHHGTNLWWCSYSAWSSCRYSTSRCRTSENPVRSRSLCCRRSCSRSHRTPGSSWFQSGGPNQRQTSMKVGYIWVYLNQAPAFAFPDWYFSLPTDLIFPSVFPFPVDVLFPQGKWHMCRKTLWKSYGNLRVSCHKDSSMLHVDLQPYFKASTPVNRRYKPYFLVKLTLWIPAKSHI